MNHPVPKSCVGERCRCGRDAAHKVEEVVFEDDPNPIRHPLVAYVCCECFADIMGPAAPCMKDSEDEITHG